MTLLTAVPSACRSRKHERSRTTAEVLTIYEGDATSSCYAHDTDFMILPNDETLVMPSEEDPLEPLQFCDTGGLLYWAVKITTNALVFSTGTVVLKLNLFNTYRVLFWCFI